MSIRSNVTATTLARYPSPLRYPGGKGKVSNFVKALIVENGLSNNEYVEPYAGGASVALSLLFEEYVPAIHINDINRGVYAFWQLATKKPQKLCTWIDEVPLTMEEWRRQRQAYNDQTTPLDELGFATFYLNRTNRSGIISRGSVIGGMDQTGRWKIDARFNRTGLIARIKKIERFADRITVSMSDARSLIQKLERTSSPRFYYLDPPYFEKGGRLYENSYSLSDHQRLASAVAGIEQPWLVSYDATPEIEELYRPYVGIRYTLQYSASSAASGAEVMYFSPGVSVPLKVQSPTEVSSKRLQRLLHDSTLH